MNNENDIVEIDLMHIIEVLLVKSSESLSGLSDIGNTLLEYKLLDAVQLKGEAIENEFVEFYPDEEALKELCIDTFYKLVD